MAKAAELNQDLIAGLKAAKSKRASFALVLKGASDGALVLSKTKVPPAAIAEAKKQSGGSAVIQGHCQYEDGKYIFETAKEAPATAAQAVKEIVKRDAGMAIHAEFRISTDPELLADEKVSSPPTGQSTQPKPDGTELMKRLNAMATDIKAALAGPNKARVQALVAAISGEVKTNELDQAAKNLAELTAVVAPTGGGAGKPTAGGKLSLVALAKSRFAWRTERINAVAEIGRLEAALSARFKGVESQKQALSAALVRLDKLIVSFGPVLDDGLDDVLNADETKRPALVKQARTLMDGFQTTIDGDEIMSVLDGNEVLPDMTVTEPLRTALGNISAALGPISA